MRSRANVGRRGTEDYGTRPSFNPWSRESDWKLWISFIHLSGEVVAVRVTATRLTQWYARLSLNQRLSCFSVWCKEIEISHSGQMGGHDGALARFCKLSSNMKDWGSLLHLYWDEHCEIPASRQNAQRSRLKPVRKSYVDLKIRFTKITQGLPLRKRTGAAKKAIYKKLSRSAETSKIVLVFFLVGRRLFEANSE